MGFSRAQEMQFYSRRRRSAGRAGACQRGQRLRAPALLLSTSQAELRLGRKAGTGLEPTAVGKKPAQDTAMS